MSKKHSQKKNQLKKYARFSSLTIQMGIIIAAGAYLGKYLDSNNTNQTPVFTIIFSIIGIGVALYTSLKNLIKK